ncbi:MAG TPA: nucleotidyltransferase [Clostridiaceae bacterium]|nr:nucleotidyltransferase [Clostridiaceae bacterium]
MKENRVLGIIAEYNPFHNGHMYHLQKAKEQSGAQYCICVMSGNFVQRGNTSIVNKWKKAEMALLNGVDLVIELPTIYSVASAEGFSLGAIKLLNNLKIVDAISFGTETSDFAALNNISSIVNEEPMKYKSILNSELKKGLSFPKARENALMLYLNDNKRYDNILNTPNNILAIEYLKALKKIKSTIQPIPVKREKVYYNDNVIVDEFASATAIRKLLKNEDFSEIRKVVPKSTYQILKKETELGNVVLDLSRYEKEIIYNLRRMTVSEIAELPDVNEGLEHSLKNAANYSNDITNLINIVKTKRYTVTRIQRILICALLGITKRDVGMAKKAEPYIRVLGFNEKGKELISRINKQNPKATVITSVKKFQDKNNNNKNSKIYKRLLDIDIFSTNVYTMACKSESLANLDYTKNMVIL